MHPLLLFTVLLGLASDDIALGQSVSPTRRNNEAQTFAPGEIIWQDEFDSLDTSKWSNEINMNGGGNNEFQIYDNIGENAYVRDGVLYIRPTLSLDTVFNGNYEQFYNGYFSLDNCTDENTAACSRQANYPHIHSPIVSQRLRTKGAFSFRYGRVEVKARMPSGDWTWPAIWMLPEEWKYGGWPASGEIDIVESRGNRKLFDGEKNIGSELVGSTLHFGPRWPYNGQWAAHGEKNTQADQGYDRDFHIFEVVWNTEMIQFKVDGTVIKTVTPPADGGFFELGAFPDAEVENPWSNGANPRMAPFDENFHLILNVAAGGAYFPGNSNPTPPWGGETPFLDFFNNRATWQTTWQGEDAAMAVDYIRVYAA
jgi:beta-glucanase (GH16 family)